MMTELKFEKNFRTTICASLFVPVSRWSQLKKLFVLPLVQKVKIIRMRTGMLHLGGKPRSVKALLRAKFENGFEEMLDEVGDFIDIRREDFPQFLWQFL